MPILDKIKVSSPIEKHSKLDLSHSHLTTSNFMDMQPVFYRHMIPSEKLKVQASAFARLAPMAVPTYGRCRLNMRAFFVPFRTVMPRFTEFIEDTVASKYNMISFPNASLVGSTPIIKSDDIYGLFTSGSHFTQNGSYSYADDVTAAIDPNNPDPDSYDFYDGTNYWKFTAFGRRCYKILRSLGYNFMPSKSDTTPFSALALLSYLRVYFDWYSVSAYMDTMSYQLFASWFAYDDPSIPLHIDSGALDSIFRYIYRCSYDGDYFTAAWDNPVAPNSTLFTHFILPDVSLLDNAGQSLPQATVVGMSNNNGTPTMTLATDGTTVGSKYSHDALRALTDYMKRHQLVGARAIDRYLADWGINLPADKLMRSSYLGMSSIDIRIGDVMSHADTAGANNPSNLGDYAGRGDLKGGKVFEFQTSEFGLFVIVSTILPTQGYVQGFDRNNLHITKDQFFNADFDNLGVQGIAKGELYVSKNANFAPNDGEYLGIFGYTPRYAEYKVGRDFLTGDISLRTALNGGDAWHLMRIFDDDYWNNSIANVMHNLDFCLGRDAEQYSRIFNYTKIDLDKFYLYYDFNAVAYAPCKSLFDTYEFENNGKDMVLDANGVKMN